VFGPGRPRPHAALAQDRPRDLIYSPAGTLVGVNLRPLRTSHDPSGARRRGKVGCGRPASSSPKGVGEGSKEFSASQGAPEVFRAENSGPWPASC